MQSKSTDAIPLVRRRVHGPNLHRVSSWGRKARPTPCQRLSRPSLCTRAAHYFTRTQKTRTDALFIGALGTIAR